MVHLPIFILQLPGIAMAVFEEIIVIAKFDFVETDEIFSDLFDLKKDDKAISDEFARLEFNRTTVIAGGGLLLPSLFFGFIPILAIICLSYYAKRF